MLGSGGPVPAEKMISELGIEKWSVISERGVERSNLTYEEARRAVHRLASEGRHGLCIITDGAAARMGATALHQDQSDKATKD